MKVSVDGKIMDLVTCGNCGAMKVFNQECACQKKEVKQIEVKNWESLPDDVELKIEVGTLKEIINNQKKESQ